MGPTPVRRIAYDDHLHAFGELWLPTVSGDSTTELSRETRDAAVPVVVLIHGGFWRGHYALDLMDPLAPSLVDRGVAVWNIEYRRVGGGGGYPATLLDVAAAIDHLVEIDRSLGGRALDLDRVAVVGHSAGGQLAVWSAGRHLLTAGLPGAEPLVTPALAVSQAGVVDLVDAARRSVGQTAVVDLLGGSPDDVPDRYEVASPAARVPIDARVLLVHGARDEIVPLRQSERYRAAATASGADVELIVDPDAAHFEHLEPGHPMWTAVLEAIDVFSA